MNTHVDAHPASDLVRDTAMRAATLFAQAAMSTLAIRVSFHAALCGGPVLRAMLDALAGLPASRRIDWPHVHLYAVDDSWDEATVARLAASPAAPRNVQRPRVADVARHEAARRYEQRGAGIVRRETCANGRWRIIPVANFHARIVRDILLDDGEEERREFDRVPWPATAC